MKELKEMVQGTVKFKYFRENTLWYSTECGFLFPIPLLDTQGATFNAEEKGTFFMRWIRKYREECLKTEACLQEISDIGQEIEAALNKNKVSDQEYFAGRNGYIPKRE